MSLRSFTVLAHSLRKREDLDLRPARIHSIPGPRSFAFHAVARKQPYTLSADRQRCGRLPSAVHPFPAGQRRMEDAIERRLRRAGCESSARLSRHLQTDVSVERHLSRIRPCLTRPLARCLSRALSPHRTKNVRRGPRCCGSCAALLRTTCALRVSAFRKSFCQRQERKNIFRTFRKRRRLALGAGHTRVASRRSVPSKNRANPNRRNSNGTLYQHRHREGISGQAR